MFCLFFPLPAAYCKEVSSTPTSPHKETLIPFKRSISAPGREEDPGKQCIEKHTGSSSASEIASLEINHMQLKAFSANFIAVILRFS
jgi:hypothetical protein